MPVILKAPHSSMQFALKRCWKSGNYTRRPYSRGARCIGPEWPFYWSGNFETATFRRRLQIPSCVNVSERTVRRRMEEINFKVRRPARGRQLFRQHQALETFPITRLMLGQGFVPLNVVIIEHFSHYCPNLKPTLDLGWCLKLMPLIIWKVKLTFWVLWSGPQIIDSL